jgi:enoyl-CoA hydratase/carnithine racemase
MGIYEEQLRKKTISAKQAAELVKNNDRISYSDHALVPLCFDAALADRAEELKGVILKTCNMAPEPACIKKGIGREHIAWIDRHFNGISRKYGKAGLVNYVVSDYGHMPLAYERFIDYDICVVETAPMDIHGYFNFGLSNSEVMAALRKSKLVIVETNKNIPVANGGYDEAVHISEVDYIIEGSNRKLMLEVMKEEPRNNELLNEGFAMPGRVVRQIRNVRKPVIAVLNGAVAGAAANIALWCDFRIASEDMVLLEAFVKIGLVTDGGGAYILTKIVGVAKATELIMTGKTIDSAECLRLGLVNEVVPNEELQDRAIAFAKRFVKGPGFAYKHLKNLINISAFSDMGGYLDMEAELQRICGASEDVLEGMTAFVEKRKPVYKGK